MGKRLSMVEAGILVGVLGSSAKVVSYDGECGVSIESPDGKMFVDIGGGMIVCEEMGIRRDGSYGRITRFQMELG